MTITKVKMEGLHMRITIHAVLLMMMGLMLCSCFLTSDVPVGQPDKKLLDQRLVGTWHYGEVEEEMAMYLHIGLLDEDTGVMDMAMVFHDDDQTLQVHRVEVHGSRLAGDEILNIRDVDGRFARSGEGAYLITKYNFDDDDTLHIWYLNGLTAKEGIENETLQGESKITGWRVTDTSENFAAYLEELDRETYWEDLGTFHRVVFPEPPEEENENADVSGQGAANPTL